MSPESTRRRRSLRWNLVFLAGGYLAAVATAAMLGIHFNARMQADLRRATAGYLEEQRIADALVGAVNRQMLAAAVFPVLREERLARDFETAGENAYREIRRYLFRDLSPDERLQLETIKEQHQSMEVAAAEAFQLVRLGDRAEAERATETALSHSVALQAAVTRFRQMREADLQRLASHQARAMDILFHSAGAVLLFLFAVTLAAAHYVYRRIAAPLAELSTAAARLGAGDLGARVAMPHHGELATVAQSFNRMAEQVATTKADLERQNEELAEALARLQETQAELVQTEKLSAMGRMMAGLAHELNNPLASVLGFGELLEARLQETDTVATDEVRFEFLDPIVGEARRARELVQNLLAFVRRTDSESRPVSIDAALRLVTGIRSYAFSQAGLDIRMEGENGLYVRADPQRLQQVFLNIVNNAFDAMKLQGGGTLAIRRSTRGGRVVIEFQDEGPGIPYPDRAFEPFFTTKPVGEGTGLGLSIVHRFLSELGGSVTARNTDIGAELTITLPAGVEPGAAAGSEQEPALALPDHRPRVLVVEDESSLRDLQRRLLARLNADVLLASCARDARAILQEQDVDLVISDVKMPGGSGLDLYDWIEKERPALADRFLFVTGDVGDPEIASLAQRRPDRFIRKPFQMKDYLHRVADIFAG